MPRLPVPSLFQSFELIQYLAPGLSGEVYKARYKDGSIVALKIFDKEQDKTIFGYFSNEQLLLNEVTRHRQHPHIVAYVTSNLVRPPYYLATRYVDGARDLGTMLGKPLNPGFALRVVEQIGSALDYLHYEHPVYSPIIHRDVKPANILIDLGGNAVLIDLSIARHPHYALESQRGLGTPQYMAPEQYLGEETPATDQFALAVVALHMLAGRALLPGRSGAARKKLDQLRSTDYAEVRKQLGVRAHTAAVIVKALQFDPDMRYPSCQAFAVALRQALLRDGESTQAQPLPIRRANSSKGYLAMVAIALVAVPMLVLGLMLPGIPVPTEGTPTGIVAPTTTLVGIDPTPTLIVLTSPTVTVAVITVVPTITTTPPPTATQTVRPRSQATPTQATPTQATPTQATPTQATPTSAWPLMPDLRHKTVDEVVALLRGLGFNGEIIADQQSRSKLGALFDQYAPNTVVSSSPGAGIPLDPTVRQVIIGVRAEYDDAPLAATTQPQGAEPTQPP